jgi:hypothetical protein
MKVKMWSWKYQTNIGIDCNQASKITNTDTRKYFTNTNIFILAFCTIWKFLDLLSKFEVCRPGRFFFKYDTHPTLACTTFLIAIATEQRPAIRDSMIPKQIEHRFLVLKFYKKYFLTFWIFVYNISVWRCLQLMLPSACPHSEHHPHTDTKVVCTTTTAYRKKRA